MTEDIAPTDAAQEQDPEEDAELYSIVSTGKRLVASGDALATLDDEEHPLHKIEFVHDVPLKLSVEIGQATLSVREILALNVGKIIEFTKVVGEPMDITVSGRLMARGEVVVVNERYGVRISEVTRSDETAVSSVGS